MGFIDEIEADNPILWLWLDEAATDDTAADHSGNGRNGTFHGTRTSGASLTPSLPGASTRLGSDGYVEVPASPWQQSLPLTAEIWFRWEPGDIVDNTGIPDTVTYTSAPLFGVSDLVWVVEIRSFNDIYPGVTNPTSSFVGPDTDDVVPPSAVHQAVLSIDNDEIKVWVDGQPRPEATNTFWSGPLTGERPSDPLLIGARKSSIDSGHPERYHFGGWVQHALMFGEVLSDARVLAHWLAGNRRPSPPPLRRFPRSDGLGIGPRRHFPPPESRRAAGGYH
jgi:hypothetical protein